MSNLQTSDASASGTWSYESFLARKCFYLRAYGVVVGPYSASEILSAYIEGKITTETLCASSTSGKPSADLNSWEPARSLVPELLSVPQPATPKKTQLLCVACFQPMLISLPLLHDEILCSHCSSRLRVATDKNGTSVSVLLETAVSRLVPAPEPPVRIAADIATPDQLYLIASGTQQGPFPFAVVKQSVAKGALDPDVVLAWHDALPDWVQLRSITGVCAPVQADTASRIISADVDMSGPATPQGISPANISEQAKVAVDAAVRKRGGPIKRAVILCLKVLGFIILFFVCKTIGKAVASAIVHQAVTANQHAPADATNRHEPSSQQQPNLTAIPEAIASTELRKPPSWEKIEEKVAYKNLSSTDKLRWLDSWIHDVAAYETAIRGFVLDSQLQEKLNAFREAKAQEIKNADIFPAVN